MGLLKPDETGIAADHERDMTSATAPNLMPEAEIDECIDGINAATDVKVLLSSHPDFDNKMKAMQKHILVNSVKVLNRKVQDFLQGEDLYDKLRTLTGDWLTEMNRSTSQLDASQCNTSMCEKSSCAAKQESLEPRVKIAEDKLNLVTDKLNTLIGEIENKNSTIQKQEEELANKKREIEGLKMQLLEITVYTEKSIASDITSCVNTELNNHFSKVISPLLEKVESNAAKLEEKLNAVQKSQTDFIQQADENLADNLAKEEINGLGSNIQEDILRRVTVLEKEHGDFAIELDSNQQYPRREILNFLKIPFQGNRRHPEDTYQIVITFLRQYLDIHIQLTDISICHRQVIPSDKRSLGKKYIPPIYCKFLHRSLVHRILEQRHLLKGQFNRYGDPLDITENLTPKRRLLLEAVETKLNSFNKKWVKNGDIFVKKYPKSRPIKIVNEASLNKLLENESSRLIPTKSLGTEPKHGTAKATPASTSKVKSQGPSYAEISEAPAPTHPFQKYSRNTVTQPLFSHPAFSPIHSSPSNSQALFRFKGKSFINYNSFG